MVVHGRRAGVSSHLRLPLRQGWQACAVAPGAPLPEAADAWLPCRVPTTAAAVLRAAGRWRSDGAPHRFDAEDWCWRLRFDRPAADEAGGDAWVLGFDGLATLAQVRLNGAPLLDSDNMFLRHAVDVTGRLAARDNLLEIRCHALDAALAARRPRPRWKAPLVEHGQLRWLRTSLLGRTPGWSPPAPAVGPYGEVWLERRGAVSIDAVALQACHVGGDDGEEVGEGGALTLAALLVLHGGRSLRAATLTCRRDGHLATAVLPLPRDGRLQGTLRLPRVAAWWPHTHGEPALYDVALQLDIDGLAAPVQVALGRVGFRRITVDRRGGGFAVHVNGVPVFCRGACWTPPDPVSLQATPAALQAALAQVRAAGMNMLRVAGPTLYEHDAFYDACDAAGVLVWQDFMFANMDYPADDPAFAAAAQAEVVQQAQRLGGHACLAVLCGNSEQEQQAALWGVPRELIEPPLFHRDIPALCARHAPGVPYWPSSAHGGAFPFRPDAGTCSYYGVGAYLQPLDDALDSGVRFATECLALANVPGAATLARARRDAGEHPYQTRFRAAERDFHAVRDHYFAQLTGVPAEAARAADERRFLAVSRWVSGHVMSEAFVRWRSRGAACRGALVWFLRDLQAGAGWGLLDDRGAPKAAWHLLRRVLQPLMVALLDRRMNGVDVELANDGPAAVDALLEVQGWHGAGTRIVELRRPVHLPPRSVQSLPLAAELGAFMDFGHAYRFGPPPCELLRARLLDAAGAVLAEHLLLPQGLRAPLHDDVGLAAGLQRAGDAWLLTLRAAACAVGVHVESLTHAPVDDYVTLAPGESRRLLLQPLAAADADVAVPPALRVAALNTRQACEPGGPGCP